jgi:hypothetical protein
MNHLKNENEIKERESTIGVGNVEEMSRTVVEKLECRSK